MVPWDDLFRKKTTKKLRWRMTPCRSASRAAFGTFPGTLLVVLGWIWDGFPMKFDGFWHQIPQMHSRYSRYAADIADIRQIQQIHSRYNRYAADIADIHHIQQLHSRCSRYAADIADMHQIQQIHTDIADMQQI